ncbi:MAG TPA: arginine decarboxylase, pyruvoyl-dependent [Firmicutes bacterium]|nr:arginine decarboxylase, pyruvoyl-dependent [Bacillota bacterium]
MKGKKNAANEVFGKNGITASIPDKFFLVAGHSEGSTKLNVFDKSLVDAEIGNTNIMKMSSILPPAYEKIRPLKLPLGSLVPMAYASKVSTQTDEIISAAVVCAVLVNPRQNGLINGLIMEYSAAGHKEEIEKIVRGMAEEGMRFRKYKIKEIHSIAIQHKVVNVGAVYAAVVLWW